MFITRFRRSSQIRRRKSERETLREDAARFRDLVVLKSSERGVTVPPKLLKELERAPQQRDGTQRLYKLDLRRAQITDPHVEALADALKELAILRKLDLRGNDITARAVHALNDVLKVQVELFRVVQADASLADSSLSFLYSIKLDAAALSSDREAAEVMHARTAALEVADSVLDVRHAFYQADVRETGTLTEHELCGAMRTVMGTTPKVSDAARILRFFGERGSQGQDPALINLGGFEAAMAGKLREAHTLPVLTKGHDELLFGAAGKDYNRASECYSLWSTRSFRLTDKGGLAAADAIGGSKRGSWSISPGAVQSSAGTPVPTLPPWRDGESGGTGLSETLTYGKAHSSDVDCSGSGIIRAGSSRMPEAQHRKLISRTERGGTSERGGIRRQQSKNEGQQEEGNDTDHAQGDKVKTDVLGAKDASAETTLAAETAAALPSPASSGRDGRFQQPRRADTPVVQVENPTGEENRIAHSDRSVFNNVRDHSTPTDGASAGTGGGQLGPHHANEIRFERTSTHDAASTEKADGTNSTDCDDEHKGPALQAIVLHEEDEITCQATRENAFYEAKAQSRAVAIMGSSRDSQSSCLSDRDDVGNKETLQTRPVDHSRPAQRSERALSCAATTGAGDTRDRERLAKTPPALEDHSSARNCAGVSDCDKRRAGSFESAQLPSERGRTTLFDEGEGGTRCLEGAFEPGTDTTLSGLQRPAQQVNPKTASQRREAEPGSPIENLPLAASRTEAAKGISASDVAWTGPGATTITAIATAGRTENLGSGSGGVQVKTRLTCNGRNSGGDHPIAKSTTNNAVLYPTESEGTVSPVARTLGVSADAAVDPVSGEDGATLVGPPPHGGSRSVPATCSDFLRTLSVLDEGSKDSEEAVAAATPGGGLPTVVAALSLLKADSLDSTTGFVQEKVPASLGTPWCLAPTNVAARARAHPAATISERKRLAAHIEFVSGLSAGSRGESKNVKRTPAERDGRVYHATELNTVSPRNASNSARFPGFLFSPRSLGRRGLAHGTGSAGETTGKVEAHIGGPGTDALAAGFLRPEEEQPLTVRLEEGALFMSRNGLGYMGVTLQLGPTYGCGRDALLALHTLVLSCNQLQVLECSVLTAMPSLQHLDVSHNLLCRMEPIDGRDLPVGLETLNMSHNRISKVGGIGHCGALRVMDLSHNRIKSALGLEHLSHLEQLDLGHNLISTAVSARALSFNRSLKMLWLEGNPFAANPRYRPTLTCLLPHVRAIDRKGMPPNSHLEHRSAGDGGTIASAAGTVGRSSKVASKEFQEEQDERRSNEWRHVVAWREEQAQRATEARERKARDKCQLQAADPAHQRHVAQELARPHPRARVSEVAVNRAKDIACRRSTIAFGITYRPEDDNSTIARPRSTSPLFRRRRQKEGDFSPSGRPHEPYHGRQGETSTSSTTLMVRDRGGASCGVSQLGGGSRSSDHVGTGPLAQSGEMGTSMKAFVPTDEAGGAAGTAADVEDDRMGANGHPPSGAGDDYLQTTAALFEDVSHYEECTQAIVDQMEHRDGPQAMQADDGVVVSLRYRTRETRHVTNACQEQMEALEKWLTDVAQETETAATALQVLLTIHKERGKKRGGLRRLTGFRTALEGMGLFAEQYGPVPEFVGDEGVHADRVLAAARRVAMTKAAVKNMLRLMEMEPGGSPELDQYADFVRQQEEIMLGDPAHDSSKTACQPRDGGLLPREQATRSSDEQEDVGRQSSTAVPAHNTIGNGAGDGTPQSPVGAGSSLDDGTNADQRVDQNKADGNDSSDNKCAIPRKTSTRGSIRIGGSRADADNGIDGLERFPPAAAHVRFADDEDGRGARAAMKSSLTVPLASGSIDTMAGVSCRHLANKGAPSSPNTGASARQEVILADKKRQGKEGIDPKSDGTDATPVNRVHVEEQLSFTVCNGGGDPQQQSVVAPNVGVNANPVSTLVVATGSANCEAVDTEVAASRVGLPRPMSAVAHAAQTTTAGPRISAGTVAATAAVVTTGVAASPAASSERLPVLESEIVPTTSRPTSTGEVNIIVEPEGVHTERPDWSNFGEKSVAQVADIPLNRSDTSRKTSGRIESRAPQRHDAVAGVSPLRESVGAQLEKVEQPAPIDINSCPEGSDSASASLSTHVSTRDRLLRHVRASVGSLDPFATSDSEGENEGLDDEREESGTIRPKANHEGKFKGGTKAHESVVRLQSKNPIAVAMDDQQVSAVVVALSDRHTSPNETFLSMPLKTEGSSLRNESQNSADDGHHTTLLVPADRLEAASATAFNVGRGRGGSVSLHTLPLHSQTSQDVEPLEAGGVGKYRNGDDSDVEGGKAIGLPPMPISREQEHVTREAKLELPKMAGEARPRESAVEAGETLEPVGGRCRAISATVGTWRGARETSGPLGSSSSAPLESNAVVANCGREAEGTIVEDHGVSTALKLVLTEDNDDSVVGGLSEAVALVGGRSEGEGAESDAVRSLDVQAATSDGKGGEARGAEIKEASHTSPIGDEATAATQVNEKADEDADVEPAWIEGYDPSHDCYYYHHVPTGESSWYKPDAPYEPYVHSDEDDELQNEALADRGHPEGTKSPLGEKKASDHRRKGGDGDGGRSLNDTQDTRDYFSGLEVPAKGRGDRCKAGAPKPAGAVKKPKSFAAGSRRRSNSRSAPLCFSSESRSGETERSASQSGDSWGGERSSRSHPRASRRHGKRSTAYDVTKEERKGKNTHGVVYRRQCVERSALERLNNLTDENDSASDGNASDGEKRGGVRRDRRDYGDDDRHASKTRGITSSQRARRGSASAAVSDGREARSLSTRRRSTDDRSSRKHSPSDIRRDIHRDRRSSTSGGSGDGENSGRDSTAKRRSGSRDNVRSDSRHFSSDIGRTSSRRSKREWDR